MANVMIVDDDPDTRRMLARLFGAAGHAVTPLPGGAGVLALLRARAFDVVLLDVMMPGVDGFAVLAVIRADAGVGRTRVVMYSAIGDPDAGPRALALGADAWVPKGTPFALLCERVVPPAPRAGAAA